MVVGKQSILSCEASKDVYIIASCFVNYFDCKFFIIMLKSKSSFVNLKIKNNNSRNKLIYYLKL